MTAILRLTDSSSVMKLCAKVKSTKTMRKTMDKKNKDTPICISINAFFYNLINKLPHIFENQQTEIFPILKNATKR